MDIYKILVDADNGYRLVKNFRFKHIFAFTEEDALMEAIRLLQNESKGYFSYSNVRVEKMSTSEVLGELNRRGYE